MFAPARHRLLVSDVFSLLLVSATTLLAFWVHHGGLGLLVSGWTGLADGLAEFSGLLVSCAALAALLLVARGPVLERRFGLDRLFVWHRFAGETMTVLLGLHVLTSVWAWSRTSGLFHALGDLTGGEDWMAAATVGSVMVTVVCVSSLRSVRRRLDYETWYFLHLCSYVGLVLAFPHTVVLGSDLAADRLARWFFLLAHLVVLGLLVRGRWGGLLRSLFAPARVIAVDAEGPGVVSFVLRRRVGRGVRARPGQFFLLRQLTAGQWWKANPFSLSALPRIETALPGVVETLRFTVKDRGDASGAITRLPVGARVALEGPFGALDPTVLRDAPVLFVAAGVGIGPVLSLASSLPTGSAPVVLYRASGSRDLVHLDELRAVVSARGGRLHVLTGPRRALGVDPFSAESLRAVTPDVSRRHVVVCGGEALVASVVRSARLAGVPASRVHRERAWW